MKRGMSFVRTLTALDMGISECPCPKFFLQTPFTLKGLPRWAFQQEEWHMKRRRIKAYRHRIPPTDWAEVTLALIGGAALAGSGFEAEQADIWYSERVVSTPEVDR
jgi:hypothetical protein